jgi:hypothetical protein
MGKIDPFPDKEEGWYGLTKQAAVERETNIQAPMMRIVHENPSLYNMRCSNGAITLDPIPEPEMATPTTTPRRLLKYRARTLMHVKYSRQPPNP